ncbi:MAG: hypothetical protein L0Y56_15780 [Nitrospira sp.]|nr:hypothetical protein [Nitrospira sp.]
MTEEKKVEEVNFSFVANGEIRGVLEDYWHQAQVANRAGVYAAVISLCGGVLEGLLAWAISLREEKARKGFPNYFKNRDGTENPISNWSLTPLINVARGLDLVGKTSERLLRAVQEFRNFIHPYNVLQQSARPDKRLANISLQTVGEVVRSLKRRMTETEKAESAKA